MTATTKRTSKIDLSPFCGASDHKGRYDLSSPFVFDGWEYATDGAILVRVSTKKRNGDQQRKVPPAHEMFACFPKAGFAPWPAYQPLTRDGDCYVCNGKGRIATQTCEFCEGLCSFRVGKKVKPCPVCGGGEQCWNCHGEQRGDLPREQDFDGVRLSVRMVHLIRGLPSPLRFLATPGDRVYFTFKGGQGIVMGLA